LVELTLKLLHFVGERSSVLLLKAIEKFELRGRTRGDFFDFVLAEDVRTEYLIAVERDRDGRTSFVHHLYSLVGRSLGRVSHVGLCANFDPEPPVSKIRFDQSVDSPMPLRICLLVWHESEAEAKKLKGGCLSSPTPSDQAVQAVGEFQLRTRQKPSGHTETQQHMVGRLVPTLICHIVILS